MNREVFAKYFAAFEESEEYKRASHRIFHLDENEIKYLTISSHGAISDHVSVNNRKEIEEFIKIYQQDVLEQDYEEILYYDSYGASVEFFINQEYSVHFPLAPSYKGTVQWLKEKDLLEQISINPEKIESIQIVKDGHHYFEMDSREIASEIEGRSDALKVEDKEQIGELLQSTTGWLRNHQYTTVIHYSGRKQIDVVYMDEQTCTGICKRIFS